MYKLINQKEIKDLVAVSYNFLLPSKLEMQCKKGMYFSFDFGCLREKIRSVWQKLFVNSP